MGTRFHHGSRRRRIIVASTRLGTPSGVASSVRNRVVVVPRPPGRKPNPLSLVRFTSTKKVSGGKTPPHNGGGGTPKPLQPTWLAAVRARGPRPLAQPVVVKSRYVQPPVDGTPNQIVVVAPPRRRTARPAVVLHPTFKWGLNPGVDPNPPVVVVPPRRRRFAQPVVVKSPPTRGLGFRPPTRPVVVARPVKPTRVRAHVPVRSRDVPRFAPPASYKPVVVAFNRTRRVLKPTKAQSPFDAARQKQPRRIGSTVVARPRPARRFNGIVSVLAFDAAQVPPASVIRPIVVPSRLKGARAARFASIISARTAISYRAIPTFDPIVVPVPRRAKAAPWNYSSLYRKFVPPPPRRDPQPRTLFIRVPRRTASLWPAPLASMSIRQPDVERYDKPWDLIAACIAWLRTKPHVVAEFGDVKGTPTGEKFVSDVALPKTDLPYAIFSEPEEVEEFESPDQDERISSRVHGVFQIHVHDREKLLARQKADNVAEALNDAPLVFTDGVLMYLRRSTRRYPTYQSVGPGANVAAYVRVVEFNYMIERFN
jgi:hypothetical protein